MRRKFDADGKFVDQHGDYPKVVKEVAAKHKLALIDLTALSLKVIEQHGAEGSKKIFMHYQGGVYPRFPNGVEDNTHFSPYGAHIMAKLVADELVRQKHPLKKFLKES
jgi:DNA sulfur modification protein DndE